MIRMMLLSALKRIVRVFVFSIIASLICFTIEMSMHIQYEGKLLALLALFFHICLVVFDTYGFSKMFVRKIDFLLGLLIPYVLYIVSSFLWLFYELPAGYFKYIFLSLRAAENFGTNSLQSLCIINGIIVMIVLIMWLLGKREGEKIIIMQQNKFKEEFDEEIFKEIYERQMDE